MRRYCGNRASPQQNCKRRFVACTLATHGFEQHIALLKAFPVTMPPDINAKKASAAAWFEDLQRQIITALEQLEQEAGDAFYAPDAGTAELKPWTRTDHSGAEGGGGTMGLLRGRLFEKAGVHTSSVYGTFAPEFRGQIAGSDEDPRFWASGISVIVHPLNPHVPAVHMNTRMVVTSKQWFGGGADLTPVLDARRNQDDKDTKNFHQAMRACCDRHKAVADYETYAAWCKRYFFLPHRNEERGIGGIFFDDLNSGDFGADFSFVRDVGTSFIEIYKSLVRDNMHKPWTEQERNEQMVRRGRYVEFNLLYDRGTLFGLKTGGNIESILSSLPPMVKWP